MSVNPNNANPIKLKSSETERSTWNVFLGRGELIHIVGTAPANQTIEKVPRETPPLPQPSDSASDVPPDRNPSHRTLTPMFHVKHLLCASHSTATIRST